MLLDRGATEMSKIRCFNPKSTKRDINIYAYKL